MQTVKLETKQMHSFLARTNVVNLMIKAIKKTNLFQIYIDRHEGTMQAIHLGSGIEVFAAIQKGYRQPWIVRHHKELFEA